MYSKYHIIKVLENCFQDINYFCWIKLILGSSYHSPRRKPLYNTMLIMFFIGFFFFVAPHSATRYHKYCIYQPYAKPNQSKLLSKPYTDYNTLWVKYAAHQKAESLRAALFQSQTTRLTTTLSSIQSTLNSLQNGSCSFIFRALFV